ncbi:MAG: sulfotransferase family protein [Sulfitobacter sp.]
MKLFRRAASARIFPRKSALRPAQFRKTFHLSQTREAIYVNNPKVACSTIKLALQRAELGDLAYLPERSVHNHKGSPLLTFPELTMKELRVRSQSYFIFSFVRCPYRRLQSAYLNKIVEPQKGGRLREEAGFAADELPDFARFVATIVAQDPVKQNAHWRPQWINLSVDAVEYDFIGKLEDFSGGWASLAARLNLPANPERAGKRTKSVQAAYDPQSAALVARFYARDFEHFGYDPAQLP